MKVQKLSLSDFDEVGVAELLEVKGGYADYYHRVYNQPERRRNGGHGSPGCGEGPGWPINGDHFAGAVQNAANDFGNSSVGQGVQRGVDIAVDIASDFWEVTKIVGNAASGFAFGRLGVGAHPKVLPLVPKDECKELLR